MKPGTVVKLKKNSSAYKDYLRRIGSNYTIVLSYDDVRYYGFNPKEVINVEVLPGMGNDRTPERNTFCISKHFVTVAREEDVKDFYNLIKL